MNKNDHTNSFYIIFLLSEHRTITNCLCNSLTKEFISAFSKSVKTTT